MALHISYWAGVVVRLQSGGRRVIGTMLFAGVLLLAALSITTGILVRSSVANRWDHASNVGKGPHVVVTARNSLALQQLAQKPGVHASGPIVRRFPEISLLAADKEGQVPDPSNAGTAVDLRLFANSETYTFPTQTSGRWIHPDTGNEIVIDASFAAQSGISAGEDVWLARGGVLLPFKVVGTAVDLGNCLQPECAPPAVWAREAAADRFGSKASWTSYAQWFRLDDPTSTFAFASYAFALPGRAITVAVTADEIRQRVVLVNGLLGTLVAGFGIFVLIAASILVSTTTTSRLARLRRDFGLLQMIGAPGREIGLIVLAQNLAIGLVASAAGWAIGFSLRDKLVIGPASILPPVDAPWIGSLTAAVGVVLLVVTISTLTPALRTSRLEPLAAMRPTNLNRTIGRLPSIVPATTLSIALHVCRSQKRHFLVAFLALVLTSSAGAIAAGYDSAIKEFSSGARDAGAATDYTLWSDDRAVQDRLAAAVADDQDVVASWTQTLRPILVQGQTVQGRFVSGPIEPLGFDVRAGRLPARVGEAVVGYGLAKAANITIGQQVVVMAEDRVFNVVVVGQVVDGANVGRSATMFIDELPNKSRWALSRAIRFRPGTDRSEGASRLASIAFDRLVRINFNGTAQRALPYRFALFGLALAIMAVGVVQLVTSLILASQQRVRDTATMRVLGVTDTSLIWAHIIIAGVLSVTASLVAFPLGSAFFNRSIDRISSDVGIGPGVRLPSAWPGHVRLSLILVVLSIGVCTYVIRRQLAKSTISSLRID